MTSLKNQAIQTALTGDWEQAISLNLTLLEQEPNDTETLNRLAFAFTTIGKIKDAKKTYQKVLEIDKNNPIASRNLKRLVDFYKNASSEILTPISKPLNNIFLEETGKTKVIELTNVAEPKVVSMLQTGEYLEMSIKRSKIFIIAQGKNYIGMIPEDIGRRLIKFLDGGNEYEVFVKSIKDHKVSIFIKEIKRVKKFKNQPSFTILEKTHNNIESISRKSFNKIQKENQDFESEESEEDL